MELVSLIYTYRFGLMTTFEFVFRKLKLWTFVFLGLFAAHHPFIRMKTDIKCQIFEVR